MEVKNELDTLASTMSYDELYVKLSTCLMRDVLFVGMPTNEELNSQDKKIAKYAQMVKSLCQESVEQFRPALESLGALTEEERNEAREILHERLPKLKELVEDICPTFSDCSLEEQVSALREMPKKN